MLVKGRGPYFFFVFFETLNLSLEGFKWFFSMKKNVKGARGKEVRKKGIKITNKTATFSQLYCKIDHDRQS